MRRKDAGAFLMLILAMAALLWPGAAAGDAKLKMLLQTIRMPPGFSIDVYTDKVPGARSLAVSSSGVVFVGTRQSGKVYAVVDENHDQRAERVVVVAQGLDMPNGVALWQGDLYVAEVGRILRFAQIEARLGNPPVPEVVYDQFPQDREHGWKFIRFGPDGKLYVSIGAPCNVCLSDQPVQATISRINRDGSGLEVFAQGVRNSIGFDWHPQTGELWFTDNGRDGLGDDQPPDELNHAPIQGLHFGFPHCHGGEVGDPQFGTDQSCREFTLPSARLGAHVAALGMRFYSGRMFPADYQGRIFIAEHGSWNRTTKSGYQITQVRLNDERAIAYESFAQGWILGHSAWGRPVDLEIMPDGSMVVSDDQNGVVYRIAYSRGQ